MPTQFELGFRSVLEKRAGAWDDFGNAHPLAKTLGYFTPGVSTALSLGDAASDFRAGRWGAGALSSLWAAATLVPGGTFLKGLRGASRLGQAAKGSHALLATKAIGPGVAQARAAQTVAELSGRTGIRKFFTPFRGTRIQRARQIADGQRQGIRNAIGDAYHGVMNPVKDRINGVFQGMANNSPALQGVGKALGKVDPVAKRITAFHEARPFYTKTVKALQWPAIGASLALPTAAGSATTAQPQSYQGLASANGYRSPYAGYAYKQSQVKTAQQALTYGDIIRAILNDPTLSHTEKDQAVRDVRLAFPSATENTLIQPQVAGAIGATVAWVLSRYAGMSTAGKVISSLAGFGVGRAVANRLNNPYPGYYSLRD